MSAGFSGRGYPARSPRGWSTALISGVGGPAAVALVLAGMHSSRSPLWNFATFAVLAAALAWWCGSRTGLVAATVSWLLWHGFFAGSDVELLWPSFSDFSPLLILVGTTLAAATVRWSVERARVNALIRSCRDDDAPGDGSPTTGVPS